MSVKVVHEEYAHAPGDACWLCSHRDLLEAAERVLDSCTTFCGAWEMRFDADGEELAKALRAAITKAKEGAPE